MLDCETLVVIGASTGGPQTVRRVISQLPVIDACIIIVQHMPIHVNQSITKSMSRLTDMEVKLAEDGMHLQTGQILVAPSEVHLELVNNQIVRLVEGEKVNFVRPAIDVTMNSIKDSPKIKVIGVILTGIGSDGAAGISHIRSVGGVTIAQDEASSVIYGMPRAAVETGNVDFVLPPEMIGDKISELVNSGNSLWEWFEETPCS